MNTIRTFIVLPFVFLAALTTAQESSTTFIDFGDEKISKAEFARVYKKNNSGEMVTKSTVEEYLDLYINFKLKVKEAEARGLDTVSSFVKELSGYRKQLAKPYLSADGIMEELKKEAYARLQEDIKASHILIRSSYDDSPEDTLAAFQKAMKAKKILESGKDFEKTAKEYSEDPSVENNGGNLGYFTAFYMVYPFESAAYNTKKGEISEVVRTQFGYHVLKVEDRRPAVGNITVAHLLISSDKELSKTDDPEGKINEINQKIKNGAVFEDMAAEFSDDTRSASNGGQLPMFGVGRMVPEFEKVAFSLENDGDISEPFKTQYGWHIIKRINRAGIESYEKVDRELSRKIKKDSRSNLSENAVLKKIMKQYGFNETLKERNDFYKVVDPSIFEGAWNADAAEGLNKTIFVIGDKEVNQSEFATFLGATKGNQKKIDTRVFVNKKYEEFKKKELLAYKDSKLDEEYPEFKSLMEEYHDGILLFNLTDELVWSKASSDSAGLESFYSDHKENYKWGARVDATVYSLIDESMGNNVKKLIAEGKEESEIVDELNRTSQLNVQYEKKKYEKGEDEFVDKVEWKEGFSAYMPQYNRVKLVHIKEVLEPTYKTTSDARGIITSDYQEHLEESWVKELRGKYNFSVDQNVLETLKTELK